MTPSMNEASLLGKKRRNRYHLVTIKSVQALGLREKFRATGETVAFFDTGATAIGLFPWDELAKDATLPANPRTDSFRGVTLAWNCNSPEEVDKVLEFAIAKGATPLKAAHDTDYGGYSGYFCDPDGHPWEVVVAPNIVVGDDRRVRLPD